MAHADPTPAFRGYQDEVWELMRAGESLGGVEDAIEETDVAAPHKIALWLLAFALSDEDNPYIGATRVPEPPVGGFRRGHLSLVV